MLYHIKEVVVKELLVLDQLIFGLLVVAEAAHGLLVMVLLAALVDLAVVVEVLLVVLLRLMVLVVFKTLVVEEVDPVILKVN